MASLNLAYEHGKINEIHRLMAEFGSDPEAVVGEDVASRIVKAIRRIAQLRRRLSELNAEMGSFQQTDVYQLKQTIETAEATGENPLEELASELAREIAKREAELRHYGEDGSGYAGVTGSLP
jgi:chromosome segregation ATPase